MHLRPGVLRAVEPHEIEPTRLFLLTVATAWHVEEEEFWEWWGWIEAYRESRSLPLEGDPAN